MEDDNSQDEKPVITTIAEYVIKATVLRFVSDGGQMSKFAVSSRDINQILGERPELAANFHRVLCFDFFDLAKITIYIESRPVELYGLVQINSSPWCFLPGKGRPFRLADLQDKDDQESRTLKATMLASNAESCFVTNSGEVTFFNPDKGDRVIDASEITAVNLRSSLQIPEEKSGSEPPKGSEGVTPVEENNDPAQAPDDAKKKPVLN